MFSDKFIGNKKGQIRTGLLGYGLAGKVFHSPFLASNPEFSLDFIATNDRSRQQHARFDHPKAQIVANARELEERFAELDLLVLASPVHTHLEQGLAALSAGLAVIVDKPFVIKESDGVELIRKSEEAERPLIVFHNRRWDGDFLTVKKVLQGAQLGKVFQFESSFEHWAPIALDRWHDVTPIDQGGGVIYDLGSHLIDQAIVLFGAVAEVRADVRTIRSGGGNDDVSFVELFHESGVRSHLFMNRLGAQPGHRFRMLGTEGTFLSFGLDGQEPALAAGAKPTDDGFGHTPESMWGTLGVVGAKTNELTRVPTEFGMYSEFYEGVVANVHGSAPSPVDPWDALEVVKVIERIHDLNR